MKKVLSVLLAITMLFTTMAAVSTEAFAAVPSTSITKLAPYKRQIKVFVKKNSKVSGYQIKYSTNKKFRSAKTKTLKGSSKTMARLMKLGHKKTYYFKVRTYKKSGKKTKYSKWSKVKKTTTNNKMDERYNKLIKEIYNAAKSGKATDEASAKKNLSKNAFDFFCAWNSYDVGAYTRYNELTYGFTDLDSNGIDELILGDDYGVYGIFTISAGKLCFVYGQYGRMIITVYGKTVYTYFHGGYNVWQHQFDKLPKDKTKLTKYSKYYYDDGIYTDDNGKIVPTATVDNYLSNIKKGAQPKYKFVKDLLK